jgi:hypothetical protein
LLLKGVEAVSKLTRFSSDTLLREYGRYFLVNEMTSHRCAYLLNSVQSGHAGLVASTVNQPGDTLMMRRYWRVPTIG